jgi:hypothetical protein
MKCSILLCCLLKANRRFRVTCRLHLQVSRVSQARKQQEGDSNIPEDITLRRPVSEVYILSESVLRKEHIENFSEKCLLIAAQCRVCDVISFTINEHQ